MLYCCHGNIHDGRFLQSERLLEQSLIRLLKNAPLSKISIRELCHTAGVIRSTFYAHYETLPTMIEEILRRKFMPLVSALNDVISFGGFIRFESKFNAELLQLLEVTRQNRELCLAYSEDPAMQDMYMQFFERTATRSYGATMAKRWR
mgnify:CR=1 FL=1